MIGPVQVVMIGFSEPELPADLRSQVDDLRANPAVRLLDVQIYHKERGLISRHDVSGFTTDVQSGPGSVIDEIMTSAAAAEVMSGNPAGGQGYLMHRDPVPDPKNDVPNDTNVLVLMLEHTWALPLWSSVRDTRAFPVADAWMGRQSLQKAGLDIG
jgi:hypothetical protein